MFSRRSWLIAPLVVAGIAAAAYMTLAGLARPAPSQPFFEGEKSRPQVIAHRGGAALRPENTLAAFAHALEIGADVLEMDVQLTADNAIVCIHDRTVDRTTNGRGAVAALSLDHIRSLDAGHKWSADGGQTHPFRGKGLRVPMLEEVLSTFPAARMNIEIKYSGVSLAQALCSVIRSTGMGNRVLVASVREEEVDAFRDACPEVATSMTRREAWVFYGAQLAGLEAAYAPPVRALQIPDRIGSERMVTASLIAAAHRRNLKVHVWTVNDPERMKELMQFGVDGIITDRPHILISLVRDAGTARTHP